MSYFDTDDQWQDVDDLHELTADLYKIGQTKAEFYNGLLAIGSQIDKICKQLAPEL